jgi:hypothetical protein
LLVLAGFALRVFLIFPGPLESKIEFFYNRADLRNYYWPAQAALRGENPYVLWASGQSGEFRSDMAPLELVIYVATVAVWNDPRALQILFALFDAVNIVLLGALLKHSSIKLPFQIFYALGPLTLYNLVLVPQDKTILLTLTFSLFLLLRLPKDYSFQWVSFRFSRDGLIIVVAALIAAFKWLSVFYLLPLLLFVSRDWRDFVKYSFVFGVVVAFTHLLWFPDWMYVYIFRIGRTVVPFHTSPLVLLREIGLFDKNVVTAVLFVSLATIYALFWFKRIDIFETITLSVMAGILWAPDMDPVHLSIVVLHLLLIIDWSSLLRQVTIWSLSAWVAAVYAFSTRTGFTRYSLPDLRTLVGAYGTPQMIVLSYGLFIVVFALYLFDKSRQRRVGFDLFQAGGG